jgi:type III secretory pathway lipoprotein EscJ
MEKDWIKIFSTDRPFEAEMVKGMLLENGVNAVLLNRQDSSYIQALPGQAEIYVHTSQVTQALELLNETK